MNRFTVRVVLHDNPTLLEFQRLDQQLAQIGVVDDIQSDQGGWYRLPPGEYYYQGDVDGHTVLAGVMHVARSIKQRCEVFVTEGGSRYWQGLREIPAPVR